MKIPLHEIPSSPGRWNLIKLVTGNCPFPQPGFVSRDLNNAAARTIPALLLQLGILPGMLPGIVPGAPLPPREFCFPLGNSASPPGIARGSRARPSAVAGDDPKSRIWGQRSRSQILGLLILGVGIYAEAERQRHRTLEGIFLAPAVLLLLLGITVFLVSFVGMLGSLRDNRTLLRTFFWVLLLIFLTELLLILMEIIFESKMNEVFHSNIQEGIRHYYDDLDFKNILDFVQEKFSCCGGDEFRDWEVNQYHACNGSGALACGVPHSCCVRGVPGGVVNTLCGYRALDKERLELLGTIHVRGCIHAVGLWLKDNFQATLAIVCSLLLPQVLGLAMAWLHWQQLNEIHSRLDSVDSRLLQSRDLSFASLDLRGAGWCWCLPREGGYIPVNPGEDEEEETACHSKV
ncbi:tetraspanin-15-like isoform X5 [Catharus ustulatus]|uniref:tetraspanin-15-like isoform X5 n=1 Tax=Catharus ustulatus TaxID=91951 RepID=UPI001408E3EE|nr:tetraspanin-15-like isoform X5 [Catharus ustulatus]